MIPRYTLHNVESPADLAEACSHTNSLFPRVDVWLERDGKAFSLSDFAQGYVGGKVLPCAIAVRGGKGTWPRILMRRAGKVFLQQPKRSKRGLPHPVGERGHDNGEAAGCQPSKRSE